MTTTLIAICLILVAIILVLAAYNIWLNRLPPNERDDDDDFKYFG